MTGELTQARAQALGARRLAGAGGSPAEARRSAAKAAAGPSRAAIGSSSSAAASSSDGSTSDSRSSRSSGARSASSARSALEVLGDVRRKSGGHAHAGTSASVSSSSTPTVWTNSAHVARASPSWLLPVSVMP